MASFQERIHAYFDLRISTLGRIKARTLGSDALTLTALGVLVYAQLEGGIKDLTSCVLRDVNLRNMAIGDIKPALIQWRNPDEINRFRSMVDFDMIALNSPFSAALSRRFKVKGINRRNELNQMGWDAIRRVYKGLGLNPTEIDKHKTRIEEIVNDRNDAAHHGVLPKLAASYMEKHVRDNVVVVENVLTDFSLQLLPFFDGRLHIR